MERGFQHRLLSPYRVTKQREKPDEVNSGHDTAVSTGESVHDEGITKIPSDSSFLSTEHSKDDPDWILPVFRVSSEQSANSWELR